MPTISHTRGTTVGDPLTLTDDDGAALDLTGCTVTAHVQVGGACRDLVATIPDPLIGEAWLDWDALDVPQRAYRTTLTITWADGAIEAAGDEFALLVKGECMNDAPTPPVPPPAQAAPTFTTRPSLIGFTALGGTITVDLGAASGTPAPAITGTLTRPGRAAAAVLDGATFTVEASDQGGTVQVSATATNAAGSVQDSASVAVPAAPINAIVVIGASHMNAMFGKNLTTPQSAASADLAARGYSLPVYGYATPGDKIADAPAHYRAARAAFPTALIVCHFGGGDVTSIRPFPGSRSELEAGYAALRAATGNDTRFYHASLTFRNYEGSTFENPANGSKPYNENVVIPWIAANYPHAMTPYGRPKLDFYRRTLQSYDAWLGPDYIHLTTAGYTAFRQFIMARVADILGGVVPAEIVERVYVPPALTAPTFSTSPSLAGTTTLGSTITVRLGAASGNPTPSLTGTLTRPGKAAVSVQDGSIFTIEAADQGGTIQLSVAATNSQGISQGSASLSVPAAGTPTYPKSIVNFVAETAGAAGGWRNNVIGNSVAVPSPADPDIQDTSGASTGMQLGLAFTGNPAIGATDPGRGVNTTGITTGVPAYSGQLLASEITVHCMYVTSSVTAQITISGAVPNARYELGFVGARTASEPRMTVISGPGGQSVEWNTSATTPTESKMTVTADGAGVIPLVMSAKSGTTLAYLAGISIQRIS